jgi:hypothetical protein
VGEGEGYFRGVPSELAQPGGTRREISGAQSEWGGRMIGKAGKQGINKLYNLREGVFVSSGASRISKEVSVYWWMYLVSARELINDMWGERAEGGRSWGRRYEV